jgi:hypothetical protein
MQKLSMVRRRLILRSAALSLVVAIDLPLERGLIGWVHLPPAWVVLAPVGLEAIAVVFLVKALVHLETKAACEAENGSGEA